MTTSGRALLAAALLVVVPLSGVSLWVLAGNESVERQEEPHENARETSSDVPGEAPPRDGPREKTPTRPAPVERLARPAAPDGIGPSRAAREDAERIARFDDNALAFDARIEAFDEESSSQDAGAASAVAEGLTRHLESLHPGIVVSVACTESVCLVDLSSEQSVGMMIARIAPWLRETTDVATGDPEDPSDENAMRLAFEKTDALSLFERPPESLP